MRATVIEPATTVPLQAMTGVFFATFQCALAACGADFWPRVTSIFPVRGWMGRLRSDRSPFSRLCFYLCPRLPQAQKLEKDISYFSCHLGIWRCWASRVIAICHVGRWFHRRFSQIPFSRARKRSCSCTSTDSRAGPSN